MWITGGALVAPTGVEIQLFSPPAELQMERRVGADERLRSVGSC